MTEEQDIDTQVEQDATTDGATDDSTKGSEVSAETLEIQKRKALQQRNEAREEAEKLRKELDSLKAKVVQPKEVKEAKYETNLEQERRLMAVEFTLANPQLSKDAIKEILDFAITKNIPPEKALESPVLKPFIEADIAKKKVEMAIPQGSRSGKEKPTTVDVSKMTREEHEKFVRERIEEEIKG